MPITEIIKNWVPNNSRVIDLGCGDGALLCDLKNTKNIIGYGIEIDPDQKYFDKRLILKKNIFKERFLLMVIDLFRGLSPYTIPIIARRILFEVLTTGDVYSTRICFSSREHFF